MGYMSELEIVGEWRPEEAEQICNSRSLRSRPGRSAVLACALVLKEG